MRETASQGDVLRVDRIRVPVLVVSKDFFNQTGEVIGCPIYRQGEAGPLHIRISADQIQGFVQCEKMALLDLKSRGFSESTESTCTTS